MKIHPADVDAVAEQFAGTADVCTFGFDDAFYGQNVGIAVALKEDGERAIRELHDWMKGRLAMYKTPVSWYLVDSIPRTSRGKTNREHVMRLCAELEPLDLPTILRSGEQDDLIP